MPLSLRSPEHYRSRGVFCVLATICFAAPALAINWGGIEVDPAEPTVQDEIVVMVGSPVCGTLLVAHQLVVSAGLIQALVEGQGGACVGVPPPVTEPYDIVVGPLPAGDYRIEYFLSIGGGPSGLINTADVSVEGVAVAIPTLGLAGIGLLGLLLCGAAAVKLRRGR